MTHSLARRSVVVDGLRFYRALCGCLVRNSRTKRCARCWKQPVKHPNFVRSEGSRSFYLAECGHETGSPTRKRCAACFEAHHRSQDKYVFRADRRRGPNGVTSEHRLIAEQVLGRRLKTNEVVHHINMDKRDNRRRNLLICTREYHKELHHRMELATARRIDAAHNH